MGPADRRSGLSLLALVLVTTFTLASPSAAVPLVGFVEDWAGTSTSSWWGGAALVNPGTGGVGGALDGFLLISTSTTAHLGAASDGPEYGGNWLASGIDQVRLWLRDAGSPQPLEIHFSIGSSANLWQYNTGFVPPADSWAEFSVNLGSAVGWTRIVGSGSFAEALQAVEKIHLRHDKPPFTQLPDQIQGEFGVDRVLLTNDAVSSAPVSWGRLKSLYR